MENVQDAIMARRAERYAQRERRNNMLFAGISTASIVVAAGTTAVLATTFVNGLLIFVAIWFYTGITLGIIIGTGVAIHDYVQDSRDNE